MEENARENEGTSWYKGKLSLDHRPVDGLDDDEKLSVSDSGQSKWW